MPEKLSTTEEKLLRMGLGSVLYWPKGATKDQMYAFDQLKIKGFIERNPMVPGAYVLSEKAYIYLGV